MAINLNQLKAVYKEGDQKRLEEFLPFLNLAIEKAEINTRQRICMFLGQLGHESGQFRYMEELASGEAYEGRRDLGNTSPGDGKKYKGRGPIQITGKRNYALAGLDLDLPLLEQPTLLSEPKNGFLASAWFWKNNNLNSLCDLGLYEKLTKRINGGMNGYADRYKLYQRALGVI